MSFLHRLAFLERGSLGDVDIEQVQFLVALGDLTLFVDPDQRVLGLLAGCRLVNADVDGEFVFFGRFEQTLDEFRVFNGFA